MNKTDFITEVARKANVTKAEAERVMSAFEDVVVSALTALAYSRASPAPPAPCAIPRPAR